MPRLKSVFRCQGCGYSASKPLGQCPDCSAWNTMMEEVVEAATASALGFSKKTAGGGAETILLKDLTSQDESRTATSIGELDRLLGGGVVAGQVLLVAGPPGIGKSTLMLQAAAPLAKGRTLLYVSGEESSRQISARSKRLGIESNSIYLLCETNLQKILESAAKIKPWALILDSVQTVFHPELSGGPGSISQVRECAAELLRFAKESGAVVFLLGHVTKEGSLAGPKVLEHMVDTVLYFDTERHDLLRVLRAQKNRFGPTDEIGLFEMAERGLREVRDPSSFFIEVPQTPLPGRAVSVALEGSRPLLVETQSLVVSTRYPLPRRMSTGLELNRVLVLLAAMEKHLKLRIEDKDVFVSLAGGLRLKDPALDLAACLSVLASARDIALPADCVFIGEVGLLGEVLRVPALEPRLKEAAKAGFKQALIPARAVKDIPAVPIKVSGVSDLAAAQKLFMGGR